MSRVSISGVSFAHVRPPVLSKECSDAQSNSGRGCPVPVRRNGRARGTVHEWKLESSVLNPGSGFLTLSEGNTQITGWEVFDTAPEARTIDYIGTFWQAAQGSRSVDLNGNLGPAGIRQTFDTIVGTQYQVRFALSGNPDEVPSPPGPELRQVQVQSGAVSNSYTFDAASTSRTNMGWVYYSILFTAGADLTTLSFLSLTNNIFFGPALDDVTVTAVPEPASMTLLATGIGLLVARRRRLV